MEAEKSAAGLFLEFSLVCFDESFYLSFQMLPFVRANW